MNGKGSGNCGHWVALDEFLTQFFFCWFAKTNKDLLGEKKN